MSMCVVMWRIDDHGIYVPGARMCSVRTWLYQECGSFMTCESTRSDEGSREVFHWSVTVASCESRHSYCYLKGCTHAQHQRRQNGEHVDYHLGDALFATIPAACCHLPPFNVVVFNIVISPCTAEEAKAKLVYHRRLWWYWSSQQGQMEWGSLYEGRMSQNPLTITKTYCMLPTWCSYLIKAHHLFIRFLLLGLDGLLPQLFWPILHRFTKYLSVTNDHWSIKIATLL